MRRHGAFPEPDSREPWFMSQAHAEADIVDRVVSAFEVSLAEALDERYGRRSAGTASRRSDPYGRGGGV